MLVVGYLLNRIMLLYAVIIRIDGDGKEKSLVRRRHRFRGCLLDVAKRRLSLGVQIADAISHLVPQCW